jgi:hypothetical protein
MKNKAITNILATIASLAIVWLILDNLKLRNEIEEKDKRNSEKDDINQKLKEKIEESKDIPEAVKQELEELIRKYKKIDSDVSKELITASSLIEIKEYPKAIFTLIKIIENLLKEKYSKNAVFTTWIKNKGRINPVFADFIEFAKEDGFITKDEYHFAKGLKEIRNEEGHELNVIKHSLITYSAFLLAISFILKLCKKVRKSKVKLDLKTS